MVELTKRESLMVVLEIKDGTQSGNFDSHNFLFLFLKLLTIKCCSAILFGFRYEKPIRVQMIQTVKNDVDTIVRASGIVYFSDNRVGTFDCGCELAHRSWFEIAGTEGIIRVDDQVGGDSRTGNFNAYFVPFEGSSKYIQGTKEGKDEVVNVDPCDHVIALVQRFEKSATEGPDWSFGERTALQHKVMSALFESAENGGKIVEIQ